MCAVSELQSGDRVKSYNVLLIGAENCEVVPTGTYYRCATGHFDMEAGLPMHAHNPCATAAALREMQYVAAQGAGLTRRPAGSGHGLVWPEPLVCCWLVT